MENNWRTIQVFLNKKLNSNGAPEVYEVSINAEIPEEVKCSCITFNTLKYCTHSIKILKKIKKNGGNFGMEVPEEVSTEEAFDAFSSEKSSREFVLKHGKIELC